MPPWPEKRNVTIRLASLIVVLPSLVVGGTAGVFDDPTGTGDGFWTGGGVSEVAGHAELKPFAHRIVPGDHNPLVRGGRDRGSHPEPHGDESIAAAERRVERAVRVVAGRVLSGLEGKSPFLIIGLSR